MKRLALTLALVALACGGSAGPAVESFRAALDGVLATCAETSGEAAVKRAGEGFWTSLGIGAVLKSGDWVKTGPAARTRVALRNGGGLELAPDSIIVVEPSLGEGADGGALVAVESGTVRAVLPQSGSLTLRGADGREARLVAKKGSGPVTVQLRKGKSGSTEIALERGDATVSIKGATDRSLAVGKLGVFASGGLSELDLLEAPLALDPPQLGRGKLDAAAPLTFNWKAVEGAKGYHIEISRDPAFATLDAEADTATPGYAFSAPGEGSFHWRVAARDADGRLGAWGTNRPLVVGAPKKDEPLQALLGPEDGAVFAYADAPPKVTLTWSAQDGGGYRVVIAKSVSLESAVLTQHVTSPRFATSALAAGQYYWGVFADDRPLFTRARRFTIKKVAESGIKAPDSIQKWGE